MYVIVWEFVVPAEKVADFIAAYKSDGDWARLFRLGEGYHGTELLSSADDETRFITLDRWQSVADFTRFQQLFGDHYKALDKQLEGLTIAETKLGTYTVADGSSLPSASENNGS